MTTSVSAILFPLLAMAFTSVIKISLAVLTTVRIMFGKSSRIEPNNASTPRTNCGAC